MEAAVAYFESTGKAKLLSMNIPDAEVLAGSFIDFMSESDFAKMFSFIYTSKPLMYNGNSKRQTFRRYAE